MVPIIIKGVITMKTNTTKLRRALETFAKTGKITLTASALMALALSAAPADAKSITDTLADGDTVTIEQDTTVTSPIVLPESLTIRSNTPGTEYTISVAPANANEGSLFTVPSGRISTLTAESIKFTGGKGHYVNKTYSGGLYGGLVYSDGSITIKGSASFVGNSAEYGGVAYAKYPEINETSINGVIIVEGEHLFENNSAYSGACFQSENGGGGVVGQGKIVISGKNTFQYNKASHNGGVAKTTGTVLIEGSNTFIGNTADNFGGGAIYSSAGTTIKGTNVFKKNASARGGVVDAGKDVVIEGENIFENNTGSGGGAVRSDDNIYITGTGAGNVFQDNFSQNGNGGAISASGYVFINGTNLFDGNKGYFGGAVYSTYDITVSGDNTFTNNTAIKDTAWGGSPSQAKGGALRGENVIFTGDGSSAYFDNNKVIMLKNGTETLSYINDVEASVAVTFQDAGTYTFGSGIKSPEMNILNGANVTFQEGSQTEITKAVTLTDATVTIEGGDGAFKIGSKTETGSMTANTGSTLNLVYTGSGTGTMITGDVRGLASATINTQFTNLGDRVLGNVDLTSSGLNIVMDNTAKTFNIYRNGAYVSNSDAISGLGALASNDAIVVTTTPAAFDKTLAVPENLTIRSNSLGKDRTLTASGTTPMFSTAGTSALTLENIIISGASNHAGVVGGSVITSGNWNIIGGTFSGNSISTPEGGSGDYAAKGGAIYGGTLNLQDVTFTDNIASSGDIGAARSGNSNYVRTQTMGGAVYGSSVTISGNSNFSNNRIETGNVFYKDANGQITRWMDETIGGAVFSENLNIGAEDVQDDVKFSGNVADSTKTTGSASAALGGSIGGAAGANAGTITVTAEDGDKIAFTGNKAESNYSRALGGAVGAGRNDQGSVSIKAEDGGEILFKDNTAVNNKGTMTAMGGAVFGLQGVEAEGAVFENNTAKVNVTDEAGNIVSLFDYDEVTAHSAHGGAIASHNPFGDSVVTVKDSTFTDNKVEVTGDAVEGVQANALGGAVYAAAKDGKGTGTVTLSGTNNFKNNSASSTAGDAKGGAIYGEDVAFVGDGSNAEFSGNTANGVKNDVHAESSVKFDGNGEYTFGGGITTGDNAGMDVNGSTLKFEAGSITDIDGKVTLEDATINVDVTDETELEVGAVDARGDKNSLNVTFNATENWTVDGDFSNVNVTTDKDYTIAEKDENGMTVRFKTKDEGGNNFVAMTKDESGSAKFQGGAETMGSTYTNNENNYTLQNGDYIIATADGSASTLTQDNLTIKSSDDTIRTITGTGTGTILSDISSVNLKNVELGNTSSDAATIETSKDLTVNTENKAAIASISAKSLNVAGNGQLLVNGAINGNTNVLAGANLALAQNSGITGNLTVNADGKLTFDNIATDNEGNSVTQTVFDTIEITGDLNLNNGSIIEISFSEDFNFGDSGTYTLVDAKSISGIAKADELTFSWLNTVHGMVERGLLNVSTDLNNGLLTLNVTGLNAVPEPSTWALLVLGGLGILGMSRRNRKK